MPSTITPIFKEGSIMPRAKETPIPGPNFADFAATSASAVAAPPDDVADGVADDKAPAAPPAQPLTLAEQLAGKVAEREAENAAGRAADLENSWRCYRSLLMARDPLSDVELNMLRDLCRNLKISSEQVKRDSEIVQEARQQLAHLAATAERSAALSAARTIALNLRQKHRDEETAVRKAVSDAEAPVAYSHGATYELVKLRRQRPELFTSDDPPRLRED